MKKLSVILGILVFSSLIFLGGFFSGQFFSDYDVLCEKDFTPHMLKHSFHSQSGITLPEDTVVYLRQCKFGLDTRLDFYIENWDTPNTELLIQDPNPAYRLHSEINDQTSLLKSNLNSLPSEL